MTKRQIKKREENRRAVNEGLMEQLKVFHSESGRYEVLKKYFVKNNINTIAIYGGGKSRKRIWSDM